MASNNSLCYCFNKAGKNNNLVNHIVCMKDAKNIKNQILMF